jgi:2-hydroxymuconate-semialdehyde hydrolase
MKANDAYPDAEARVFDAHSVTGRSHELRTRHVTIRALETGDGQPALFLHGYSHCSAHWAPLFARLSAVHAVSIDQPGHGGSGAVDYRGIDLRRWYRETLTDCLDALGLQSAHVVGHSQGAMQALWLALDAPERVRSVVSIGMPAVAFGARLKSLRFLARPVTGALLLQMPMPMRAYRSILAQTIGHRAAERHPDLVRGTYLATKKRAGFGTTVSSYLREMFAGADARPPRYVLSDDELARMTRPVLVIWGEGDPWQPASEAEAKTSMMPNARFEIVNGGHNPWLDDPEPTAGLVSDALTGLEST